MKSKKNRKCFVDPSQGSKCLQKIIPGLTLFKFNLSQDNISCFMSKNRVSKGAIRKISQSSTKSYKSKSKPKSLAMKKINNIKSTEETLKVEQSPDILRELSNTIISKIEEKGIMYTWNENEDILEQRESLSETDDESLWSAFEEGKEKSFASTNDYQFFQTVNMNWVIPEQSQMFINPVPCSFIVQPEYIERDWRTTLMIRNIPNKYTINELAEEINSEHANTYDFLYLPCDPKNNCNVGYGFINFVDTKYLLSFYLKFNKYTWQKYKSEKICALTYARLQGLNQLIEHFENSKVLNQKEKKYRPIIKFDKIHKIVMEQQAR